MFFVRGYKLRLNYYSLWYLILAMFAGIFYGFAATILKKGVLDFRFSSNIFELFWRLITTKYIMISICFSGFGYILYMIIIKKAEIIPSMLIIQSFLFVSSLFFAFLLFKESINLSKIMALILIMSGIIILIIGK